MKCASPSPRGIRIVHILADLLVVFAAIAATYGAGRLWSLYTLYLEAPTSSPSVRASNRSIAPAPAQAPAAEIGEAYEDLSFHGPHRKALPRCCGQEAFEIAFALNGQPVNPDHMAHALGKSVLGAIRESVHRRAAAVRCPEHGSAAKLLVSGTSLGDLSWEAPGSCPALLAALKSTLTRPN